MREVYIGADHRGFGLKEKLIIDLKAKGWMITDLNDKYDINDDYPDIAIELAEKIIKENTLGILICGSGAGACVAANKVKGARATIAVNIRQAQKSREDDDINILCLSADYVSDEENIEITKGFLEAIFMAEERFIRRINKIKKYEDT
jgi:ribose 5-phosphate isomerase B